jgi:prepilin-type N-terminal cleavage/methylation domain-containing protein
MVRRQRGYTLLEVVIALAIFGMFLMIVASLTAEMRGYERRLPINFMKHPQIASVVMRMRRDVMDAHGSDPYKPEFNGYTQSPKVLIIEAVQPNGGVQTIVWDFSTPGEVHRKAFNVGVATEWIARGVPPEFSNDLVLDAVGIPGRPWGVRLTAKDERGRIAIDQILQPRAH